MSSESGNDALVIQMDGVFDASTARDLARTLAQRPEAEVYIDLTRVREFDDFGVTVLGQAMAAAPARVSVRGLRQHHLRLLRYLGIDAGQAPLGRGRGADLAAEAG
ncbi:MAG TPA: STAS domain-containing protein [Anaeromyxobacter sp.]|nr:STAS domain-containing protein [Anaeromyxobacter sp.]